MRNFYKTDYTIKYSEVDSDYNLRLDRILDLFQDITGVHSKEIGVDGPTMLATSNAFWILTKIKMRIEQFPKFDDVVELETWPTTVGGVRFKRDYAIHKDGVKAVMGSSEWCTLDYDTHLPRKASSVCYPVDMPHRADESGAGAFVRVKETVCEDDYVYTYRSSFVDIDSNKHTNNVAYVRMMLGVFSPEEFEKFGVNMMQIAFSSQTYYGDEVRIYKKKIENGIYVEGQHEGKQVFSCVLEGKCDI